MYISYKILKLYYTIYRFPLLVPYFSILPSFLSFDLLFVSMKTGTNQMVQSARFEYQWFDLVSQFVAFVGIGMESGSALLVDRLHNQNPLRGCKLSPASIPVGH